MFRDDLLRGLGFPQINVELDDKNQTEPDDFTFLMQRTLRVIRTYFPCEYVIRAPVPSSASGFGEGYVDVSKYGFLGINDVFVVKPKTGTSDAALPWSTIRIWEQVWLGKSDFIGTDLLLYQNELSLLNQVTNFKFAWKYYKAEEKVYVTRVPTNALGIGIQGLKPIESLDDLDDGRIEYEYALKLAMAFGKQKIGHLWRKYNVQGMEMPGSEVVQEGKEEEKDIMQTIESNSYYPGGLKYE